MIDAMIHAKAQAATDFMVSYGMAFVVIAVTLYIVFHLAFFNQRLAPTYCTASPSFSCTAYTLNKTGAFIVVLSQAAGGTVNINAAACSSSVNAIGDAPAYGNVNVITYTYGSKYYPSNSNLQSTLSIPSGSLAMFKANCYNEKGIATGQAGSAFTGYLWINYTYSLLPSANSVVQRVISFSAKFS